MKLIMDTFKIRIAKTLNEIKKKIVKIPKPF